MRTPFVAAGSIAYTTTGFDSFYIFITLPSKNIDHSVYDTSFNVKLVKLKRKGKK